MLFNFLHLKSIVVHGNLLCFAECPAKVRPFRTKTYTPQKSASLGRRYSGRGRRRNPCRETPPPRKEKGRKEGITSLLFFFLPVPFVRTAGEEEEKEASIERGRRESFQYPFSCHPLFGGSLASWVPPRHNRGASPFLPLLRISACGVLGRKCLWLSSTLDFPIFLQQRRDNIFFFFCSSFDAARRAAVCYSFSPPCLLPGWAARQGKKY